MSILNPPSNPSTGAIYTGTNGVVYQFDGIKWIIQSTNGPVGPSGPAGFQGVQGVQGVTGQNGIQGIQGLQGSSIQGTQGVPGPSGAQGVSGPQGPTANQALDTTSDVEFNSVNIGSGGLTTNGNAHITGNLQVDGVFTFTGTATILSVSSATFFGDTNGFKALYAGVVGYTPLPVTVIQATADYNDYVQINFQNINPSAQASTDWVATADNGNDTTNFVDLGIAGSNWDGSQSNSLGSAVQANDSYLWAQGGVVGGNLVLASTAPKKSVKIVAGGIGAEYIVAQFTSTGLILSTGTGIIFGDGSSVSTANGLRGPSGPSGANGSNGATGPSGPSGANGSNGATGPSGPSGANGSNGATGPSGPSGTGANLTSLSTDISFSTAGVGAPTFVTTSSGTKISYYPSQTVSMVDYATGIEAGVLWNSIPSATNNFAFKWYGGTSTVATLNGLGTLTSNKFVGDGSSLTNVTVNIAGNIIGTGTNVSLVAGSYTYTFDNTGLATFPGNISATGSILAVPVWTSVGATTITATTTSPTKGVTTQDNISYRRLGEKQWEVILTYTQTAATGGANGSGDYLFTLPNSLSFDTTLPSQQIYTGSIGTNAWALANYVIPSGSGLINNGGLGGQVYPIVYNATKFRILTTTWSNAIQCWGSGYYSMGGDTPKVQLTFRFTST
jgi:hypothetical protein